MNEAKLIRVCLLGLPIGLVLLTAGSMAVHFSKPQEQGPPKIIRDLADDITTGELQGYVRNLSQVIGERNLSKPATLERAANYVESTLGPRNIGFEIHRQKFGVGSAMYRNVWVQIPGGKRAEEVIIVAANYDALVGSAGANNNATGIATLFALAQNFVDERPKRTIRLMALANGTEPMDSKASGPRAYAETLTKRGDRVAAILCLDGLAAYTDEEIAYPANLGDYLSPNRSIALMGSSSQAALVRDTNKSLASSVNFPVQAVVLDGDDRQLLRNTIAGPFDQADLPTLWLRSNGSFAVSPMADTMDQLDWEAFTSAVQGLATTVRALANP